MTLSLVDVAGANFRTDEVADQLNTNFMSYLGVKVRYLPARLAIARSLAVDALPAEIPSGSDFGKSIKGDTLFGTGPALATWTALIVERAGREKPDLKFLQDQVAAHWRRGLALLEEDWRAAHEEPSAFLRRLVAAAGLRADGGANGSGAGAPSRPSPAISGPISVPIGEVAEDAITNERTSWGLNAPGGSPHIAIMGGGWLWQDSDRGLNVTCRS